MNQQRDLARTHIAPSAPNQDDDVAPGRGSRSSAMNAPSHPVAGGLIQRKVRDGNGVAEGADAAVLAASSSGGSPLPVPLRRKFESSLGVDLAGVRVHTGESSLSAARAIGARAYTSGQDIHFARGEYEPSTSEGEHLLAHEVAHTVQQRGGAPTRQYKLEVSAPGDTAELEADGAASAMVVGMPFAITGSTAALSRKPPDKPAANGDDKKEDKPKFPSYVGDKQELKLPFGAGAVTLNMSENPSAQVEWKGEVGHKFLEFDKTLTPAPQIAPGVGLDIAVNAKAGLSVSGTTGGKAGWEDALGPRVEPVKQFTMSASAGGKVALGLDGGIKVGIAFGPPGCALAGGAGLSLGVVSEIGAQLVASGTRDPDGIWSGQVQLTVTGKASLEAKGSVYIDAVIASDRYNLYTYELGSFTVGEASIVCIAPVDLATGQPKDIPPIITFQWNGLPKAKEVKKIPRPDKLPVNQGASGAPNEMPSEEVPSGNGGQGGAGGAPP